MPHSKPRQPRRQSAGLLLFRRGRQGWEVLLAHPGGPFWQRKDQGAWTIPKGEIADDEDELEAARREFAEETGHTPTGDALPLGSARQKGGKVVHAWAIEEDWDPRALVSNTFRMKWPPRSGETAEFPEIDRASWMTLAEARTRILEAQAVILDRLEEALGRRHAVGEPDQR